LEHLTREQKAAILDALAGPTDDNRSPVSVFDVHFHDGSKVIASADQETWRRIAARVGSNLSTSDDQEVLPGAAVDVSLNSYSSDGSINWTLAAPTWQDIISGVVFPYRGHCCRSDSNQRRGLHVSEKGSRVFLDISSFDHCNDLVSTILLRAFNVKSRSEFRFLAP
jgi:hypothetical protein